MQTFHLVKKILCCAVLGVLLFHGIPAIAAETDTNPETADENNSSKLPVPRFVSLKVNSINLRTGPGERYPIEWVVTRKALPVEIIAEFDIWRRIKLPDATEGWVHQTMLSGRRTAIVQNAKEAVFLRSNPDAEARSIAEIKTGAMGAIDKCQNDWCRINFGRYGGWLPQESLWGVYPDEMVK